MTVPEAINGDLVIFANDGVGCFVFDRKLGDEIHNQISTALERENAGIDDGEFLRLVEQYDEGAKYAKWCREHPTAE